MADDIVTSLLPRLSSSSKAGFNVFDVMRHGADEKQISNVFGWLLDANGTHGLGELFQRIFIEYVNHDRAEGDSFSLGPYLVRQEVDTTDSESAPDIADLVLESDRERIVIENYFSSDGHGHSYESYLEFARRDNRRGGVVLLCRYEDTSRQTERWEQASVLTYERLVTELRRRMPGDYKQRHPESDSFIEQMSRKFAKGGRRMDDHEVLDFLTAMCATGEAGRYQEKSVESAKSKFAADVADQAAERFGQGRELLQRIKNRLKDYCSGVLRAQLNRTMGEGFVSNVSATYQGIYQWTVNFDVFDENEDIGKAGLQLKFGPSAWFANEQDPTWRRTVDPEAADYARFFVTMVRIMEIRQSAVTLQEVLDGLQQADLRLHDEIVELWRQAGV